MAPPDGAVPGPAPLVPGPGAPASPLPRGEPGAGEGVVVLTYWRPWRHLSKRSYSSPYFEVGGHRFWKVIPNKRWFRPVEVWSVPVAVPEGVVEVIARKHPDLVGPGEDGVVDRVRLYCRAGRTVHLEFVPPNNSGSTEGSLQPPGLGPRLPFFNTGTLVAPVVGMVAFAAGGTFYDHTAHGRADQVLPHLFPPGVAASVFLLLAAVTVTALVSGVWAGFRPKGPLVPLRTPEIDRRAAETAAAIAAVPAELRPPTEGPRLRDELFGPDQPPGEG